MSFNLAKFQSKLKDSERDGSFSQNIKNRKLMTHKRKSHFSESLLDGIKPKKEVRLKEQSDSESEGNEVY